MQSAMHRRKKTFFAGDSLLYIYSFSLVSRPATPQPSQPLAMAVTDPEVFPQIMGPPPEGERAPPEGPVVHRRDALLRSSRPPPAAGQGTRVTQ